jgi:Flp pilus assembly secretin CpaC
MRRIYLHKAAALLSVVLLSHQFHSEASELPHSIELTLGQGKILEFSGEVTRVYTSNPEVADVTVIDSHGIVVNAKSAGKATLGVWLQSGGNESIPITVELDLAPI